MLLYLNGAKFAFELCFSAILPLYRPLTPLLDDNPLLILVITLHQYAWTSVVVSMRGTSALTKLVISRIPIGTPSFMTT